MKPALTTFVLLCALAMSAAAGWLDGAGSFDPLAGEEDPKWQADKLLLGDLAWLDLAPEADTNALAELAAHAGESGAHGAVTNGGATINGEPITNGAAITVTGGGGGGTGYFVLTNGVIAFHAAGTPDAIWTTNASGAVVLR